MGGSARDDVETVTWANDSGDSGTADGVQAWLAASVPLAEGDNVITVTGTTADGTSGEDSITVTYTPDVPFASGLEISPRVALAGEPAEVRVAVWFQDPSVLDPDSVRLGPADVDGTLLETWAVLEETETDGYFHATFTVDEAVPQVFSLRAEATVDGVAGATPAVPFEVMTAPDAAELEAVLELLDTAWQTAVDADYETDPAGAADAVVQLLMASPGVMAVGLSGPDGQGVWWIAEPGIPLALSLASGEVMGGGGATTPRPRLRGGTSQGWTASDTGFVGRARSPFPPDSPTRGPETTGNAKATVLSAYYDHFQVYGDIATWIEASMTGTLCPNIDVDAVYLNQDVRLEAVADSFDSGLQVVSSHGQTYLGGAVNLQQLQNVLWRWRAVGPGAQVAVITREEITPQSFNDHLLELLSGELALLRHNTFNVFAYLPAWVQGQAIGNPMPNSIVGVTACRSLYNETMSDAYIASGAGFYFGYSETVRATYAAVDDQAFWNKLLERGSTGDAYLETRGPANPDPPFGAFAASDGNGEVFIHGGELANPGFEQGTTGWTPFGNGSFSAGGDVMGLNGTQAPEGSQMGYAEFVSPVGTYQEFATSFCPLPDQEITVHFKWQVISRYYGSCGAGVTNWINMRLDLQEGNQEFWYRGWDVVCPLLVDQGWGQATGWQDESVTLTAPATDHPDQESLTFSVGGWDYDGWWGLVDDIRIEQ